jgi:DNA-3-methyladenine glycosylase I
LDGTAQKKRCGWAIGSQLIMDYHDKEWGVPVHDDTRLFELLVLEGAQAGLNWQTVLRKRENYRRAFSGFNPAEVSKFGPSDVERLLADSGIVRNRLKIEATVVNAEKVVTTQREFGSFDAYVCQFVGNKPIKNSFTSLSQIPATTKESDAMSKDMRKRGFKFVGSTICYAFMQAVGMVNDHVVDCFRYNEV